MPTLLALSSDLSSSGKNELERVRDLGYLTATGLRALCVVDRGSWLAICNDWYKVPMHVQYAEVVGFPSAVTSALIHVANTRGWPDRNQYLFDQNEIVKKSEKTPKKELKIARNRMKEMKDDYHPQTIQGTIAGAPGREEGVRRTFRGVLIYRRSTQGADCFWSYTS